MQDDIRELIAIATKLREDAGGELDDAALAAVAEATGAPLEVVRVAMISAQPTEKRKRTFIDRFKKFTLSLDPTVRSLVTSAYLGVGCGVLVGAGKALSDQSGFLGILAMLCLLGAAYNAAIAKDVKTARLAGGIFGAVQFMGMGLAYALHNFLSKEPDISGKSPTLLVAFGAIGFVVGQAAFHAWNRRGARHGLAEPADERRKLLAQLVELQDKLRSNEQTISFLSLDVVGSTRMKELADPLAVEFTFGEYHRFVEVVARKHGGSIHSTAGDGVIVAFDSPWQAFHAARNILGGMPELNMYRNKIGMPMRLRAGIHHGSVVPQGEGLHNINFAHVIDIASHLQKAAPEGGIAVSLAAANLLPGGAESVGPEKVNVQNVDARIWTPRVTAIPTAPGAEPPPFQA